MTILRDQGDQGLGEDVIPTVFSIEIIQGLELTGGNVSTDQFLTGMTLPGIRGIASGESGGEDSLGVGTGAASHCCVDELDVRILLVPDGDHGFQTSSLTTTRPP